MNSPKIAALLSVFLMSFFIFSSCEKGPEIGYISGDVLNVRNDPSVSGLVVSKVYMGDKVYIINKSENKETIGGKTDYWKFISNNTVMGWVFGGYISASPTVSLEQLEGSYYYTSVSRSSYHQVNKILNIKGTDYELKMSDSDSRYLLIKGDLSFNNTLITLNPRTKKNVGGYGRSQYGYGYGYSHSYTTEYDEREVKVSPEEKIHYQYVLTNIVTMSNHMLVMRNELRPDNTFYYAFYKK